jgi:RimJ/RimL family protein N-acetyltransferase
MRPFTLDDLQGVHILRTQPEVMKYTALGRVDKDLAETEERLARFLPPNDAETYNCAICLSGTGELIGMGGVHRMSPELGWPEIGYIFKREYWGKGYATEFMRGFLGSWWELEREEVDVNVDPLSIELGQDAAGSNTVPELLTAIVEENNNGSLRVMEKGGFRRFKAWTEPDSRAGFEGIDAALVGFLRGKEDIQGC